MSTAPAASKPNDGIHHYTMLCTAALGMMGLALFLRGLDLVSIILPPLVGLTAMVFRWRTGAIGVLFFLAWLLAAQHWPVLHPLFIAQEITWIFTNTGFAGPSGRYVRPMLIGGREGFGPQEVLLCGATLAYFAAHYRLLSVSKGIFPGDPRRRVDRDSKWERRSPRLVAGQEVLNLLAPLPLWIGCAWLCWRWLESKQHEEINRRWWQVMILAWLFGLLFLITAAVLRYLMRNQMRPEEATMILQDTLWRETSREQRRITRWIAWARTRQRKREET
jgi:hypothetical protein